ncbi:hypothetical protein cyc_02957 [Cyclospora cayetanensis]|uniref:Transmembrane protein n=1 Tax=Cyclospora cayetanensis TaxID=88456 RepID=A0A1D3D212_9EIME|nr:hypothetical protein cyc_02957 [Cyclospora cayetanensis]
MAFSVRSAAALLLLQVLFHHSALLSQVGTLTAVAAAVTGKPIGESPPAPEVHMEGLHLTDENLEPILSPEELRIEESTSVLFTQPTKISNRQVSPTIKVVLYLLFIFAAAAFLISRWPYRVAEKPTPPPEEEEKLQESS